jgi:hypothetical protein
MAAADARSVHWAGQAHAALQAAAWLLPRRLRVSTAVAAA